MSEDTYNIMPLVSMAGLAVLVCIGLMYIAPIIKVQNHGVTQLEQVSKEKPVSNEPAPQEAIEQIEKNHQLLKQELNIAPE